MGIWFTSYVWQKLRESRASGPPWRPHPDEVQEILFGLVVTVSIMYFAILTAALRTGLVVALLIGSCLAFLTAWVNSYKFRKDFGRFVYEVGWKDLGHPFYAPLEIVTGFTFLLLFGAGFYGGPVCVVLAGTVRLSEIEHEPWPALLH